MTKHLFHEKILEANLHLIDKLRESPIKIKLAELIAILMDNTVNLRDAARYLKDKYRRTQIPDWLGMSQDQIVQQVRSCLKFKQQRQWMQQAEKAAKRQSPERQQIEEFMEAKNIRIEDRIHRIKQLIEKVQKELKVCQQQQMFIEKKSQLSLMKKQLKYLQPDYRLERRLLSLQEQPEELRSEVLEKVNNLKFKNHYVDQRESAQNILPKKISFKKLKQLFHHYQSKFNKPKATFEELNDNNLLSIKGFMDFVKQFKLGAGLTPNEIFQLFKNESKDNKSVSFDSFIKLIKNIHQFQCERLGIQSNQITYKQHMNENILQSKIIETVLHKKAYPEKIFNYEFKILPHSGKTKQEIIAELIDRKEKKIIESSLKNHNKSLSPKKLYKSEHQQTNNSSRFYKPIVTSKFQGAQSNFQISPIRLRKASQPHLSIKQKLLETPRTSIFHLFTPDEDPYLESELLKKSTFLPSLKKLPKYIP